MDEKKQVPVVHNGTAGSGSAGIPVLLFQMKVAACAPGIPREYWEWAVGVMECIWGDIGMMHARSMKETLVAHREALDREEAESILAD